jgi:hypothetical protein
VQGGSGVTAIFVQIATIVLSGVIVGEAAAATPDCSGARPCESRWQWTGTPGDGRPISVEIVRGVVRIVRDEGPVTVEMKVVASSSDPRSVRFGIEQSDTITIFDTYPPRIFSSWRECLPPSGQRGDFESSDAVVEAVIHAPASVAVSVELMEKKERLTPQG